VELCPKLWTVLLVSLEILKFHVYTLITPVSGFVSNFGFYLEKVRTFLYLHFPIGTHFQFFNPLKLWRLAPGSNLGAL